MNSYLRKKAIAIKRNFYTIPFVLNIIALVIFSCSTYVLSQVASRYNPNAIGASSEVSSLLSSLVESSETIISSVTASSENVGTGFIYQLNILNAFFLFVITLSSILGVVSYIKYMGKKKNYVMLGLYFVFAAVQFVLETFFLIFVVNRLKVETDAKYISLFQNSRLLIILHFVFLGIAVIVSALAPFIQTKLKNIKFKRLEDVSYENMESLDLSSVDDNDNK